MENIQSGKVKRTGFRERRENVSKASKREEMNKKMEALAKSSDGNLFRGQGLGNQEELNTLN